MVWRVWRLLGAALALVVLAGGCVPAIAPVRAIQSDGDISDVHVAVDASGMKHYLWSECPAGAACKIVYYRTKLGPELQRVELAPPSQETYTSPDLAVTGAGKAFVVWRAYSNATSRYSMYYAEMPASGSIAPVRNRLRIEEMAAFPSDPLVVARNDVLYAVYYVPGVGDEMHLYGRKLSPIAGAEFPIATSADTAMLNAVAEVDESGFLHVSYEYESLSADYQAVFYFKSNGSHPSIVLTPIEEGSSTDNLYGPPAIAANASAAYVAVPLLAGASQQIELHTRPLTLTASSEPILAANQEPWMLTSRLEMELFGGGPQIAFVASTGASGQEVWLYEHSTEVIGRITDNSETESELRIANVNGEPALAWREQRIGPCLFDAYLWSYTSASGSSAIRRIYASPSRGGACGGKLDLDGNGRYLQSDNAPGAWGGAIWSDADPAGLTGDTANPLITFNAYLQHTPLLQK